MKGIFKNLIIILFLLFLMPKIPLKAEENCIRAFENCIESHSFITCAVSYAWCKKYYS